MRRKDIAVFIIAALAAAAWATPAVFAEDPTDSVEGGLQAGPKAQLELDGEGSFEADGELDVNLVLRPSDGLINRAIRNIDRLPPELKADVEALQDSTAEIRAKWVEEYRPGLGATVEEIKAARAQFMADLSAEIEANRELRKEVVVQLREGIRERVGEDGFSDEVKLAIRNYNALKSQLNVAWREARAELGEDATRADIAAAKRLFLEENAELVAEQKEMAQRIRLMIRAEAEANGEVIARDPLPEAVQALRAEIHLARNELREQKRAAREELANLSPEERRERRDELLDELREAHNELKERRRQLIDDIRGEEDGDHRPGD